MLGLSGWDLTNSLTLLAVAIAVMGYLIGSIPFGLILTRLAGLGDVRQIGSGNIGATNVLRTGNKKLAALTLVLDILKGTVAVKIGSLWGPEASIVSAISAFLGHLFPVWLKFKGGKGVATYIGILLGLIWPACLVFCATWLSVAVLTRYSSLSALTASIAVPICIALLEHWQLVPIVTLMSLLLIIRHHANIARLVRGTETKIGAS